MRTLLERQLGLLRGLAARVEEAERARGQSLERMRRLWLEMARLCTGSEKGPGDPAAAERVRSLCRDIGVSVPVGESEALTATLGRPGDGPNRSG